LARRGKGNLIPHSVAYTSQESVAQRSGCSAWLIVDVTSPFHSLTRMPGPGLENYTFLTTKVVPRPANVFAGFRVPFCTGFSNSVLKPSLIAGMGAVYLSRSRRPQVVHTIVKRDGNSHQHYAQSEGASPSNLKVSDWPTVSRK